MQWPILLRSRLAALRHGALQASALLLVRDPAQGLVEYGLILLMIVVVCLAIVTLLGQNVSGVWYQKIVDSWPS